MTFNLDSFLQITLPLAALTAWFIKRLDKKFEKIDERFEKMEKKFDDKFDKVDEKFKEAEINIEKKFMDSEKRTSERFDRIDENIKDLGERLSFLEASFLYAVTIENGVPNPRSVAAREMWKKRRTKRLENKT